MTTVELLTPRMMPVPGTKPVRKARAEAGSRHDVSAKSAEILISRKIARPIDENERTSNG